MIDKKKFAIFIFCFILLTGSSSNAISELRIYPKNIDAAFEYDDNVTRERLKNDYQHGIIWRLHTGFGVENFIPVKGLDTRAEYKLGMRDVTTTNDEDYNSHDAFLESHVRLRAKSDLWLKEELRIWNSQNDLFNFGDNRLQLRLDQGFGKKTKARFSYANERKWFQNDVPEVRARNFLYQQGGLDVFHDISSAFTVQVGYTHQYSIYNRSPIDFRRNIAVVLDGVQRDHQNVFTLGFSAFLLNNTTKLSVQNQVLRSKSNSRAFNFDGNRAWIVLISNPFSKLWIDFTYRIVAYDLEAYQTSDLGYELGEIRTDDQSGIELNISYDVSEQVSFQIGYEHIENTVFFTRDFYSKNTVSTGVTLKF